MEQDAGSIQPPQEQAMAAKKIGKKVGRRIAVLMGITMSFFLSLTGMLLSGHFTVKGWLVSFLASTVISLAIGFAVPLKPLMDAATKKMKKGFASHCVESLISDLIYTPLITFSMVFMAYRSAVSHGARGLHFAPMFLSSLAAEMVVGFVLIMIFMPLFMKLVMKGLKMPAKAADESEGTPSEA